MGKMILGQQIARAKFVSATVATFTVLALVVFVVIVLVTSKPYGKSFPLWPLTHIATISVVVNTAIQEVTNLLTTKKVDWKTFPDSISKTIIPVGIAAIVIHTSPNELHWTAVVGTAPLLALFKPVQKLVPLKLIMGPPHDKGKEQS